MPESIKDMAVGESAHIVGFRKGRKAYRKRLMSLGLTTGVKFIVTRYAPMGDPVEIQIRGFNLSLRQEEAEALLIKRQSS